MYEKVKIIVTRSPRGWEGLFWEIYAKSYGQTIEETKRKHGSPLRGPHTTAPEWGESCFVLSL
jgi:hypothetical protein